MTYTRVHPCLSVVKLILAVVFSCCLSAVQTPLSAAPVATAKTPSSATLMPDPRVIIASDPAATESFIARPEVVKKLVARAITSLANTADQKTAWLTFASPTNVIGIKVYCSPGALSGTRPAVVSAVIDGLLAAGFHPTNIIIWDKHLADLHLAGYSQLAARYGVRVAGSADTGYDSETSYENPIIGNLVWGDFEFDRHPSERIESSRRSSDRLETPPGYGIDRTPALGRKSHVSLLAARDIQKIINITPLLNHNMAGVSGNLYSLAIGSVDNTVRFENDSRRLSEAVPEIYALPSLGDKVILNITDALICQYEGGEHSLLHYSSMLNELWFSKDPVALDTLALRELDTQRKRFDAITRPQPLQLYSNATLLELGQSDIKLIPITRLGPPPAGPSS